MFDDLYDAISRIWSWSWPVAEAEVTAVDLHHIRNANTADLITLSVAYKFSLDGDGPYTGERIWTSTHYPAKHLVAARHRFRTGCKVRVHYRTDDPSVNKLDPATWRLW